MQSFRTSSFHVVPSSLTSVSIALLLVMGVTTFRVALAQPVSDDLFTKIDQKVLALEPQVIEWRRDFHQHPELSNREFRTSAIVAAHLQSLGMEVQTGVAGTGVVGLLRGKSDSPVVALRADMDALPITEELDLPFASKVTDLYNGREVGVMHACGHDVHTASLMGVASVLASLRDELPGSVKFIFQPAEEGDFSAEVWGAKMMVQEGVLENPRPDAIFGMHVWTMPAGTIGYTPGAMMASVDNFEIVVSGRGAHGAIPWEGADPVVAAANIVTALQMLVSRNANLTEGAAVVTVGSIHGGNRHNIIPEEVKMLGTIRTHNQQTREMIHRRISELIEGIALAYNVKVDISIDILYPAVINNRELTGKMLPYLADAAGEGRLKTLAPVMIAEDFAYYANEIPGLFFFLGIVPPDVLPEDAEGIHSPRFYVHEEAIKTGMRTMSYLAVGAMLTAE